MALSEQDLSIRHLVTETSSLTNLTRGEIDDSAVRKQIKIATMYGYVSRMMAHYLPWDRDFKDLANDRTLLMDLPPEHPFIRLLEYSDLIRKEDKISVNYPRLGIVNVDDDILVDTLAEAYNNPKRDEPREISYPHKDGFYHDTPAVAVFGSASSADESCGPIGTAIGEKGLICIIGGNGKEPGNAMQLIAQHAHEAGARSVGMITTGYLYNAQGATRLAPETQIYVAETMDERIRLFWERSDVFLGIKGGLGVIMEILYVINQNILHTEIGEESKPIYLYNHEGFWDTFMEILEKLELQDEVAKLSTIRKLEDVLSKVSLHPVSTTIKTS